MVHIFRFRTALACAIVTLVSSGCVAYGGAVSGPHPPQYFDIPKGQMPPPWRQVRTIRQPLP